MTNHISSFRQFIKRASLILLFALSFIISLPAQDASRAASTKIVDALNQLPAQDQSLYNRLMEDIISTGPEGVDMLLGMLLKQDGSYVPVQYALSGLSAYVSDPKIDTSTKEYIINAYLKTLPKVNGADGSAENIEIKEFIAKQLKVLGYSEYVASKPAMATISLKQAKKELKKANKAAKKEGKEAKQAFRSAALEQYILAYGIEESEQTIIKALKDDNREYRFAALNTINGHCSDQFCDRIAALLPEEDDQTKIDILYWLGEQKGERNASDILNYVEYHNLDVATAAVWAATKKELNNTAKRIALLLLTDEAHISLAEECLKSTNGDVASIVAPLIGDAPTRGKIAIVNILAQRRAFPYKQVVFEQLESQEQPLKEASFNALKAIAQYEDLATLKTILTSADKPYINSVQDAIIEALSGQENRYSLLLGWMNEAAADQKELYLPMVIKSANTNQIFDICKTISADDNQMFDIAFKACLTAATSTKNTGEQQLILLRKAMEMARNNEQKVSILNGVTKTNTLLGILFAGRYLDCPELAQAAATAIRVIALGNPEFHGPEITALLERCCSILNGPDSQYEITAIRKHLAELPKEEGFVSMFNGVDLSGWKGLVENPFIRASMKPNVLAKAQKEADKRMNESWVVENGNIVFVGKGFDNLCTEKQYGDFEMYLDWMLYAEGNEADAGVYLRGTPQVQMWDTSRVRVGAQVGSGGLYNNVKNLNKPLKVADNRLGDWNSFYIKMVGERVTVYLNGELVVDDVVLENFWDRSYPIFPIEQIELQAHGTKVAYRDLYIKELKSVEPYKLSDEEQKEGFDLLFDGVSLHRWQGNKIDYSTDNGTIAVRPTGQGFGNLYTDKEYGDFVFRFEFKLTPGANNGIGIRAPLEGDAAYVGMEIQVLDHYDDIYQPNLRDYQYHGSVYGIIPAQNRDALKPVGEWNCEEIYAKGDYIRVTVNGIVITEGNIREATANGTYDGNEHPGLFNKKGYIGFLGHGSELWFRHVRIKELK